MTPLVFYDFIILLSQNTSLTFERMQEKMTNVLLKFSDLKPPFPEIRGINQQVSSENRQLVAQPGPILTIYVAVLPSFFSFPSFFFGSSVEESVTGRILQISLSSISYFYWNVPLV